MRTELVLGVEAAGVFLCHLQRDGVEVVLGGQRGEIRQLVLPLGDAVAQAAWVEVLGIAPEVLDDLTHVLLRLLVVADRELGLVTRARTLHAQHAVAGRVEGADPRRLQAEQLVQTLLHLARRLVGEGDGEDAVGTGAGGLDQVGDAVRDDAGLARASAGDDQQGAFDMPDRGLLIGIQPLEDIDRRHD